MPESDKVVNLSLNASGLPVPDQDPVKVKQKQQKVKWAADFPFTINIEDYTDLSHGSGGGAHHCTTGYFNEERIYKYSITANGKVNDPDLDVKP